VKIAANSEISTDVIALFARMGVRAALIKAHFLPADLAFSAPKHP